MTYARLLGVVLGAFLVWCGSEPARSEPLRTALVISNVQYGALPPLAVCGASAALVRDTLRERGIEVVERSNLGRGEFDTAIGHLARRAASSPSSIVAMYYCGYALEFNGRSFLLPTSATLGREYDVLTQGIISKSVLDSLTRAKGSGGFVLLDVFRTPNAAEAGLARLVERMSPSSYALIGVSNEVMPAGPTPAAMALRDEAAKVETTLDRFTTAMGGHLARNASVSLHIAPALAHPPTPSPVPAPPAASSTSSTSLGLPPPAPPPPEPSFASPRIESTPGRQSMGDEEQMSEQDRRLVQIKLATLGYYIGRIDGNFGLETRAAIRRYQFEIKAEMTGRLTAEQATRLVNSVR
jgi:hypothetical protein